ncbi:hypothetical protein AB0J86_02550 [Micromonospora sp. NPDC049559]|uniref:hypothetical protein n=1 Tax=Micromonospora sp. NPDC049559 TaxID=3155923 RepID=UPI00344488D6
MTAGRFGEVDIDLLADYVGGALEGTPDEDAVARLIAEEPEWAEAYATLVPAVDSVRGSLAGWGTSPVEMPADVSDRLLAALAQAGPVAPESTDPESTDPVTADSITGPGPAPGEPEPGRTEPGVGRPVPEQARPVRQLRSVPAAGGETGPGKTGSHERRSARSRRWARRAGPVAVAAAVAAFAGFGVSQYVDDRRPQMADNEAATGAAGSAPEQPRAGAGTPRALLNPAGNGIVSTGTDYTPESLAARFGRDARGTAGTEASGPGPAAAPDGSQTMAVSALDRLADRDALAACLNSIASTHMGGELAVDQVEYASFQRSPALVVTFADASGTRWVWVAGPDCGLPGSGADTRYQAQVG